MSASSDAASEEMTEMRAARDRSVLYFDLFQRKEVR